MPNYPTKKHLITEKFIFEKNCRMQEKEITLSIETAIRGGSIALLSGDDCLDNWIGDEQISKAEVILEAVRSILINNDLEMPLVNRIVVSRGPGSSTGVRVGMAFGLGLKRTFNCQMVNVSALEALSLLSAREIGADEKIILTAVPIGRNQVCWQKLDLGDTRMSRIEFSPKISTFEDFFDQISGESSHVPREMVLHRKLYTEITQKISKNSVKRFELIDAGENIAFFNGLAGIKMNTESDFPRPIYIQEGKFSKTFFNE